MGQYLGRCRSFYWLLRGCAGNWVKLRPPKQKPTHSVPTVQFETTSTRSHAFSTPVLPGLGMISLLYMRRGALGRDWGSHAASTFSIGIQMGGGILLTSYNHPKASKQCASDIISSLNQQLVVRVSMRPWLLIFKHIIEHSFPRKWTLRSVFERKEN